MMKKLLILLTMICALAIAANAQCTPDNSFTEAGLYPEPDSLDCFVNDQQVNAVIYFKNFDTVAGLTIESLRVDSITNLPCGMKYRLNEIDRTYDGGQAGCIELYGTVNDFAGQYKLGIYVTLTVTGLPTPISGDAGELAEQFGAGNFSYYVRMKTCPDDECFPVDTSDIYNREASCPVHDIEKTNYNINCPIGVSEKDELINMQIYPNPTSNSANVSFYANNAATYSVRIVNIFGQEVSSETLNVVPGLNNTQLNVSNLSTGVYICTITDGKAVSTQRFVVE